MRTVLFAILLCAASTPAPGLPLSDFIAKGKQVVTIARTRGLSDAAKVFANPKNGFLDITGSGLHVWAMDARGVIVFDLSGQTSPGTDISKWVNEDGVDMVDVIVKTTESPDGGLMSRFKGVPHSGTNQMMDVDCWCARVQHQAIVCATFWPDAK